MTTVNFSITGEHIYNIGRAFMIEGRWPKAIELFHKGLIGIDLDLVTHLCKGDLQLTGVDDIEIVYQPDRELQEILKKMYSGILYRNGKYYRPYAKVTNYGPYDYKQLHYKPVHDEDEFTIEYRSHHYIRSIKTDIVVMSNVLGAILLEEIPTIPFWLKTHTFIDRAVEEYEKCVSKLIETGHKEVFESDPDLASNLEYLDPREFFHYIPSRAPTEEEIKKADLEMCPVVKSKGYNFEYAWLSPSGQFYPCKFGEHSLCASNIVYLEYEQPDIDPEEFLEKAGWFKLTYGYYHGRHQCILGVGRLTENQRSSLFMWCHHNNQDYTEMVKHYAD